LIIFSVLAQLVAIPVFMSVKKRMETTDPFAQ
jgi:hypothetical protein